MVPVTDKLDVRFSLDLEKVTIYYKGKMLKTLLLDTIMRHFTDWEIRGVHLTYNEVRELKKIIRRRLLHGHF